MIDRLEAQTGAMTAFINGPIGDTGPNLSDGSTAANLELAMELGGEAASDAVRAYRSIKDYRPIDMKVMMQDVKLPYKPQMSYEDAVAEYATHTEEEKMIITADAIIFVRLWQNMRQVTLWKQSLC